MTSRMLPVAGILGSLLLTAVLAIAGDMPSAGSDAPDFTLKSNQGAEVSLRDYRGKWVVLYFYPKDFTEGCTIEARNFQRDIDKYTASNAVILGVSFDTAESHKSFCEKEGLNFKLLADPEGKVSSLYGSVMQYKDTRLSARNTFIIDPQGKIARVFTGVKPMTHSQEVLAAIADLQKSAGAAGRQG